MLHVLHVLCLLHVLLVPPTQAARKAFLEAWSEPSEPGGGPLHSVPWSRMHKAAEVVYPSKNKRSRFTTTAGDNQELAKAIAANLNRCPGEGKPVPVGKPTLLSIYVKSEEEREHLPIK